MTLQYGHALRGATALAAQIEIDHAAAIHPIVTRFAPMVSSGARRASASAETSRRAEVLDMPTAIELEPDAGRTRAIRLRRTDHEGQVETRVACAAVELQPFGPRVLPHRRIRHVMEAIDLPENRLRRCLRPRDIVSGVAPVAVERDFGIAASPAPHSECRRARRREQRDRRGAGTTPRDVKVQPRGCGCAADSIEACRTRPFAPAPKARGESPRHHRRPGRTTAPG